MQIKHLLLVAALLILGLAPAYSADIASAQDTAGVNLDIERYLTIDIVKSGLNMLVTSAMVGGSWEVLDTSSVRVDTNYPCAVKCPDTITLNATPPNGTSFTTKAKVTLVSGIVSNPYQRMIGSDKYWFLDLAPGQYSTGTVPPDLGTIQLMVSIDKVWGFTDPAGTYTGTITLEVGPRP
ncbi:MAG TPA: hypothetical protein VGM23_17915 [Armatimonadota bacterium]|jgi:opacity protein-like surface antigen